MKTQLATSRSLSLLEARGQPIKIALSQARHDPICFFQLVSTVAVGNGEAAHTGAMRCFDARNGIFNYQAFAWLNQSVLAILAILAWMRVERRERFDVAFRVGLALAYIFSSDDGVKAI